MKKSAPRRKSKQFKSTSTYRAHLWKLFSLYIRTRDSLYTTGTLTKCRCITCEKIYPMKEMNAGHFLHNGNDFDERNIHAQCIHCNHHLHGNGIIYYRVMISMYGNDIVEELMKLKRESPYYNWTTLEAIEKDIKKKLEYIKNL